MLHNTIGFYLQDIQKENIEQNKKEIAEKIELNKAAWRSGRNAMVIQYLKIIRINMIYIGLNMFHDIRDLHSI